MTKAAFEEWDYRHSQQMRSSKATKRKGVKFSEEVDEKYFESDRDNGTADVLNTVEILK